MLSGSTLPIEFEDAKWESATNWLVKQWNRLKTYLYPYTQFYIANRFWRCEVRRCNELVGATRNRFKTYLFECKNDKALHISCATMSRSARKSAISLFTFPPPLLNLLTVLPNPRNVLELFFQAESLSVSVSYSLSKTMKKLSLHGWEVEIARILIMWGCWIENRHKKIYELAKKCNEISISTGEQQTHLDDSKILYFHGEINYTRQKCSWRLSAEMRGQLLDRIPGRVIAKHVSGNKIPVLTHFPIISTGCWSGAFRLLLRVVGWSSLQINVRYFANNAESSSSEEFTDFEFYGEERISWLFITIVCTTLHLSYLWVRILAPSPQSSHWSNWLQLIWIPDAWQLLYEVVPQFYATWWTCSALCESIICSNVIVQQSFS